MKIEAYPITTVKPLIFTFTSVGRNGKFDMVTRYDFCSLELYNLAFGVQIDDGYDIDDVVIINNGDLPRILGTVIQSVPLFFEQHPNALVRFMGSDLRRTQTYCKLVSRSLPQLRELYYVFGSYGLEVEFFQKDEQYESILFQKRLTK